MAGLLRLRAWSVLALLAGITSVWAWDVRWLRLACAAGLMVGIAQQLGELTRLATSRLTETLQR
jgi:hypothetical protein